MVICLFTLLDDFITPQSGDNSTNVEEEEDDVGRFNIVYTVF